MKFTRIFSIINLEKIKKNPYLKYSNFLQKGGMQKYIHRKKYFIVITLAQGICKSDLITV